MFNTIWQYSAELVRSHAVDSKILLWEQKANNLLLTCENADYPVHANESCVTKSSPIHTHATQTKQTIHNTQTTHDIHSTPATHAKSLAYTSGLFSDPKSFTNKNCIDSQSFSVVVSGFNLHKMSKEDALQHCEDMKRVAPFALLIDYETPERNLGYASYAMLYAVKNLRYRGRNRKYFNAYMKRSAMEGLLFNLNCHVLSQKQFLWGTVGVFLVRWS